MTVLFVSDATTVSGAEHVMLAHIDALRARGDRCHVLRHERNERLVAVLDRRGVPHRPAPFSRALIRTTLEPRALMEFRRAFHDVALALESLAEQTGADIVHAVSYPAVLYVALSRRLTPPLIWHEHNIKRIHRFNRPILRFVASRCAAVLGPSTAVTRNLALAGVDGAKLRTVYNGVDLARFVPGADAARRARALLGLEDGQPAIGLIGQLLPYKGHGLLIAAARALVPRWPSLKLFFVGARENPPYEQQLRDDAAGEGLSVNVVFTGWRADVHEVAQAMDVLVVPTMTPEPAALTLLEAMALARPLVASQTGGTPEIVIHEETGLLVPPADPVALASAIERLLENPSLGARLGAAGRHRVEVRFTMHRHLEEMLAIYDELRASPGA